MRQMGILILNLEQEAKKWEKKKKKTNKQKQETYVSYKYEVTFTAALLEPKAKKP